MGQKRFEIVTHLAHRMQKGVSMRSAAVRGFGETISQLFEFHENLIAFSFNQKSLHF